MSTAIWAEMGVRVMSVLLLLLRVFARPRAESDPTGVWVTTCGETKKPAFVGVNTKRDGHGLLVDDCSLWPRHQGCGQACLKGITSRPIKRPTRGMATK